MKIFQEHKNISDLLKTVRVQQIQDNDVLEGRMVLISSWITAFTLEVAQTPSWLTHYLQTEFEHVRQAGATAVLGLGEPDFFKIINQSIFLCYKEC